MQGFCNRCGRATDLEELSGQSPATDRGPWLYYKCECGHSGYILEGDLSQVDRDAWERAAAAKRKESGIEKDTSKLRAHWLN